MKSLLLIIILTIFVSVRLYSQNWGIVAHTSIPIEINYDSLTFNIQTLGCDSVNNLFTGLDIMHQYLENIFNTPYFLTLDSNLNLLWQYEYKIERKPVMVKNIRRLDETTVEAICVKSNSWYMEGGWFNQNYFNNLFFKNDGELMNPDFDTSQKMLSAGELDFPLKNTDPEWSISFFMDSSADIVYNVTSTVGAKSVMNVPIINFNKKNIYHIYDFEYNYDTIKTNNDDFVLIASNSDLDALTNVPVLCYFDANGNLTKELALDSIPDILNKILIKGTKGFKDNIAIVSTPNHGLYSVDLNNFIIKNYTFQINESPAKISDIMSLPHSGLAVSGSVKLESAYYPFFMEIDSAFVIKYQIVFNEEIYNSSNDKVLMTRNPNYDIYCAFKYNQDIVAYKLRKDPAGVAQDVKKSGNDLLIYPNPANGKINFKNRNEFVGKDLEIYDSRGILLMRLTYDGKPIDTGLLGSGKYFIKVGTAKSSFTIIK